MKSGRTWPIHYRHAVKETSRNGQQRAPTETESETKQIKADRCSVCKSIDMYS